MKPADFFDVPEPPAVKITLDDDPFDLGWPMQPVFNEERVETLRRTPLPGVDDLDAALALTALVHDELQAFGTSGQGKLNNEEVAVALRALRAVLRRLALSFDLPFRDLASFRTYWIKNDMSGSWAARREYLETVFEPLHLRLLRIEEARLEDELASPISPRSATGWPDVDREIQELRRHFHVASTPQDYRGIGTDCVGVLEALGRTVYDPQRHLRSGETTPPPDKTKQRLGRFIEDALPGPENAELRGLATKTIELAHHVKHRTTPNRRDAGIAADAVILLANMLRRLSD